MRKRSPPVISYAEFVTIVALMMAMAALSIDIMLPALHDIGGALNVRDASDIQQVVTAFLVGFGSGQLLYGPLSDRFGRKPLLLAGVAVFLVASAIASGASSFPLLLAGRFLQGFGAAAPRVIAVAVVRDRYGGAQMAHAMSLVMMIFIVVPIIAPALGQVLLWTGSWRLIFVSLCVYAIVLAIWVKIRLPESLPAEKRMALSFADLRRAYRLTVYTRVPFGYTVAMALIYSCLMAYITNAAQVFKDVYGLGDMFPVAFGAIAAVMIPASYINARLVGRLGVRNAAHLALLAFVVSSAIMAAWSWAEQPGLLALCTMLSICLFFFSWIFSNFNAIAMEPLGAVAGTASAFIGFFTTSVSAVLAWFVGELFDGTVVPMTTAFAAFSSAALLAVWVTERGRFGGR